MHVSPTLLLELGVLLLGLTVFGTFARRWGLSPIPLYLLAGLSLGEGGIVEPDPAVGEFIESGATIGLVLLLLVLGLEFSVSEFSASLRRHLPSAGVDLVLNATPGALAGVLLGMDLVGVLALAGATYVSSSGIIARLLSDLKRLANRETPSVLSVLVLEDFAMGALTVAFLVSVRWGHHVDRMINHPDDEQLMLRVLGLTLVVAAAAEFVHASAAVGAFLVGLTLSADIATRSRAVLTPLRDLFAAVFFVSIGLAVDPTELVPVLPAAVALAAVTAFTKFATGRFAAARDGVGARGRLRAGAALVTRGEFSLVIVGLAGATAPQLAPLVAAYVVVLAIVGPLLAKYLGAPH